MILYLRFQISYELKRSTAFSSILILDVPYNVFLGISHGFPQKTHSHTQDTHGNEKKNLSPEKRMKIFKSG
ncbi:MAG TPA: hypothetical protein DCO72_11410 [Ruminococcus sp.]|nr:hypothetical protein [Ruminococcus sp.]